MRRAHPNYKDLMLAEHNPTRVFTQRDYNHFKRYFIRRAKTESSITPWKEANSVGVARIETPTRRIFIVPFGHYYRVVVDTAKGTEYRWYE